MAAVRLGTVFISDVHLGMAKHGTRVIYVPGNHDEVFRELLVLHGDEFDSVVKCSPWLAKLGSRMYDFTLRMNRYLRRSFPYWWLASYFKHKVKSLDIIL